ncbi:hypothetical protein PQR68_33575 [Paraburkholderia agricolaris]|uniref:hypothetical protein n=1 Tax=Paraburkholderia agricolaris TaxID=2152888 RepID=UPI001292114F|nr:hypothetical protein [Paraburkholderia agricolaris]
MSMALNLSFGRAAVPNTRRHAIRTPAAHTKTLSNSANQSSTSRHRFQESVRNAIHLHHFSTKPHSPLNDILID